MAKSVDDQKGQLGPAFRMLREAQKAVPAMKYALALAGLAAAASIATFFVGNSASSLITLALSLIGMVILFVFARMVAHSVTAKWAAEALVWLVMLFFAAFLVMTVSAFAVGRPCAWASFIGVSTCGSASEDPAILLEEALTVPQDQIEAVEAYSTDIDGVFRLQDRSFGPERMMLGAAESGGGSYYSILNGTHAYGSGVDFSLDQGSFNTGFYGVSFGWLIFLGKTDLQSFSRLDLNFPSWVNERKAEAWRYFFEYVPPTDEPSARVEKARSSGFTVGEATIAEQVPVTVGGAYLLRSIDFDRSDIVAALYVLEKLNDGSVVVAYKVLDIRDVPPLNQ